MIIIIIIIIIIKVTLESLLTRSRERLTGMASRLKVIERYETLNKELKERIRDLAISYTSQVGLNSMIFLFLFFIFY